MLAEMMEDGFEIGVNLLGNKTCRDAEWIHHTFEIGVNLLGNKTAGAFLIFHVCLRLV